MSNPYRINSDRLWQSLLTFATYGKTSGGGVSRLALSQEDKWGRDTLRDWALESGFSCDVDELGNMFIRRAGKNSTLDPVMTGSHADSQPLGGNYDGIYGVLAGLEVLRTLNDFGIETERDLILVNWTNEEGARFAPAMLSSGVWSGVIDKSFALSREDSNGVTVSEALTAIDYRGSLPARSFPLQACYELHIEQGPILEAECTDIGIVHAAMGQRWFTITLTGFAAHAGTTPMNLRQDALCAFAQLALAVENIGQQFADNGRATIGKVFVTPNSPNVVPSGVECSVEFRHPDSDTLARMEAKLTTALTELSTRGITTRCNKIFDYAPIQFNANCIAHITAATENLGYSHQPMVSGAGHDACYINRVAPTAMIFIPCVKGISHNEAEEIYPEWSEKGANVLLHTLLAAANDLA